MEPSSEYCSRRSDLRAENIFLTGATGVLGGYLLKELLASTKSRIYCLVRAESTEHAATRLLSFLRVYDPRGTLEREFHQRVCPIVGEVSQKGFGLPPIRYQELTRKIDVVLHAAAITNLFLSFRRIEPVNVGGTRNIIDFALQTEQRYLCYISTYTVMGDKTFDPSVVFSEKDYDIGQGFEFMTYQRSKFIAEGMVRAASQEGLRWNVMRPGQIFGDSTTGYYPQGQANIIGLFYDIFKTVIETGVAFDSATHFDVVPVDYVSRGILALGLRPEVFSQTYHLTNPDTKTYSEVISLLRTSGYSIRAVTQCEYKRLLFERGLIINGMEYKSPTTSAFRWWFKREGFDFIRSARTDCRFTQETLAKRGITCAPVDDKLMRIYVKEAVNQNYFPAPTRTRFPATSRPEPEVSL